MRPRKKIGAPPTREPRPGERFQLGVRVTPEAKRRLEKAAASSGRSISQEAELRLERSFDREDLLIEVLSLAYGRQLAGILMMLGSAMNHAGVNTLLEAAGGPLSKDKDFTNWIDDPDAYEQAQQGVAAVLAACSPNGKVSRRKSAAGEHAASEIIRAARKKPKSEFEPFPSYAWTPETVRSLLGPIAERLAADKPKQPRNALELAIAVVAASHDLTVWSKSQGFPLPAEPINDILESNLKQFLRSDWDRRNLESELGDEGQHSSTWQEKLAAQIRRRA
jgi:hypothetical protein